MSQERTFKGCTPECLNAHRTRQAAGCTCGAQERYVNPEVQRLADALAAKTQNGHGGELPRGPVHRLRPAE